MTRRRTITALTPWPAVLADIEMTRQELRVIKALSVYEDVGLTWLDLIDVAKIRDQRSSGYVIETLRHIVAKGVAVEQIGDSYRLTDRSINRAGPYWLPQAQALLDRGLSPTEVAITLHRSIPRVRKVLRKYAGQTQSNQTAAAHYSRGPSDSSCSEQARAGV